MFIQKTLHVRLVSVNVFENNGLKNMYVLFKYNNKEYKSSIKIDTLLPTWNEGIELYF
jgi:Ca2+-dependent lipid-binding protein